MDNSIFEKDKQYIANTYGRFPVAVKSGKGSIIYDIEGKRYIDMGSGIATNSFGICDDEWTKAITAQLSEYAHVSNLYYSEPQVKLAELLCRRTGMKKIFFGNSGAEANEGAIKAARKYASDNGKPSQKIITLVNSFHGRTVTTLSATGQDVFHHDFGPFTEGFDYAPANDIEAIQEKMFKDGKPDCAAVMVELVQGEGGVLELEYEYVKELYDLCKANDILFIVDEVQTGNGRTGTLYCYEQYDILPDIVTTAKGLGGGLPIGAVMLGEKVANTLTAGTHGSTFGGNPICAAGAYNIISRIDNKLLLEVQAKNRYIIEKLGKLPGVEYISGKGLMLGIKTTKPAKEVISACIASGVLVLSAKDKVRLLPALNIPMDILKEAVEIIAAAIDN